MFVLNVLYKTFGSFIRAVTGRDYIDKIRNESENVYRNYRLFAVGIYLAYNKY